VHGSKRARTYLPGRAWVDGRGMHRLEEGVHMKGGKEGVRGRRADERGKRGGVQNP
jgi:hypothetical protein